MTIFGRSFTLVQLIVRILILLLVLFVLAWGIVAFIGLFTDDSPTVKKPQIGQTTTQSGISVPKPTTTTTNPTNKPATTTPNSSTNGKTTGGQALSTSTQIPNSGPGDVVALFVAATAVGYIGYQITLRKRFQS